MMPGSAPGGMNTGTLPGNMSGNMQSGMSGGGMPYMVQGNGMGQVWGGMMPFIPSQNSGMPSQQPAPAHHQMQPPHMQQTAMPPASHGVAAQPQVQAVPNPGAAANANAPLLLIDQVVQDQDQQADPTGGEVAQPSEAKRKRKKRTKAGAGAAAGNATGGAPAAGASGGPQQIQADDKAKPDAEPAQIGARTQAPAAGAAAGGQAAGGGASAGPTGSSAQMTSIAQQLRTRSLREEDHDKNTPVGGRVSDLGKHGSLVYFFISGEPGFSEYVYFHLEAGARPKIFLGKEVRFKCCWEKADDSDSDVDHSWKVFESDFGVGAPLA